MECNYRLNGSAKSCKVTPLSLLLQLGTILMLGALYGCASNSTENIPGKHVEAGQVRVLVNLVVEPQEMGEGYDSKAIKNVQNRVIKQLRASMPSEDYDIVRSYRLIPVMAFSANAEILLHLLQMPEVRSIEPDLEMKGFD
ncbi:MAG: hypothetical protein L3J26_09960 [Candidatus Polarisedimenticolaceae bacterium]|nr:hypothetical protein [Candidatus Polarisedimenticolaceae bacterium]